MNQRWFTVLENRPLTPRVNRLRLRGDTSALTRPGQFVNLALPGFFLRRPFSVCDYTADSLTILYQTVGKGTAYLATLAPGASLDLLVGLGNGFDPAPSGEFPALCGGGVGTPPLYRLCRELCAQGKHPTVCLGFRNAAEVLLAEEFAALGADVRIATEDGSCGVRGFLTALIPDDCSYVYACGSEPMLRAVYDRTHADGQYSFEERMGCGFGICMGCSCKTKYGSKRICKDGPVLQREEIVWETHG